jgi:hypothetical protein
MAASGPELDLEFLTAEDHVWFEDWWMVASWYDE